MRVEEMVVVCRSCECPYRSAGPHLPVVEHVSSYWRSSSMVCAGDKELIWLIRVFHGGIELAGVLRAP